MLRTKVKQSDAAISKALRAARAAEKAALDDLRTNDLALTWDITEAISHLEAAAKWMRELLKAEAEDEKPEAVKPQPKPAECAVCGEEIEPGEEAACSGCNETACPGCMDGEFCSECAEEED